MPAHVVTQQLELERVVAVLARPVGGICRHVPAAVQGVVLLDLEVGLVAIACEFVVGGVGHLAGVRVHQPGLELDVAHVLVGLDAEQCGVVVVESDAVDHGVVAIHGYVSGAVALAVTLAVLAPSLVVVVLPVDPEVPLEGPVAVGAHAGRRNPELELVTPILVHPRGDVGRLGPPWVFLVHLLESELRLGAVARQVVVGRVEHLPGVGVDQPGLDLYLAHVPVHEHVEDCLGALLPLRYVVHPGAVVVHPLVDVVLPVNPDVPLHGPVAVPAEVAGRCPELKLVVAGTVHPRGHVGGLAVVACARVPLGQLELWLGQDLVPSDLELWHLVACRD